MNEFSPSYDRADCIKSVLLCIFMSSMYVGSLYVWGKTEGRNHPSTIKKRTISVAVMSFFSAVCVYFFADRKYFGYDVNFLSLLGLRLSGLISSIVLPLALTVILFLGPISLQYQEGLFHNILDSSLWSYCLTNVLWLRNHVVAPFFEEFTFRACMLPILVPCFGGASSVILCPFFFGIAHLHHLSEKLADGAKFKNAVFESLFQFAYTTVFGAYSTFLFLRTGHFCAPFIVHAFCNFMGFPDFGLLLELQQPVKLILMLCFVVGLSLWMVLLYPMTDPSIYGNEVYSFSKILL